jgi:pimeloyl-ACP methyl ester carboxylesterase
LLRVPVTDEKGPYVLAGHSMGGYDIRVYTGEYPNDVVGMVLVDASHENQELRAPKSIRKWQQFHGKHPGWEKLKYFFQLHLGWVRLTAGAMRLNSGRKHSARKKSS